MEPIASNAESLPVVWQQVGSAVVFLIVTVVMSIGWIKKNNPFAKDEPKAGKDTVVLSAAIADSMAVHKLSMAIDGLTTEYGHTREELKAIERVLKDIYEEQERTNRILKDLL